MATKKKTDDEIIEETVEETVETDGDGLEEIFIPRAGAKEDQNLFVSVNGVNYLLPRGKKSRVPAHIAYEIRRSQEAYEAKMRHMDELLEDTGK